MVFCGYSRHECDLARPRNRGGFFISNRTTLPPRQLDPPPHALTACELVFSAVVSSEL